MTMWTSGHWYLSAEADNHPDAMPIPRKPQLVRAQDKLLSLHEGMTPAEWIAACYQALDVMDVHGEFPDRDLATTAMMEVSRLAHAVLTSR
jgi:hypothetical protein